MSRLETKQLLQYTGRDGCAKHTLDLEACGFFHPSPFLFQKSVKGETLSILELQITKELEDSGILKSRDADPFCSCFKGQTNGAPVSACVFCQNSRDNICAHPRLKISCQRILLLK